MADMTRRTHPSISTSTFDRASVALATQPMLMSNHVVVVLAHPFWLQQDHPKAMSSRLAFAPVDARARRPIQSVSLNSIPSTKFLWIITISWKALDGEQIPLHPPMGNGLSCSRTMVDNMSGF